MLILLSLLAAEIPVGDIATIKTTDIHMTAVEASDEPAVATRSRYRLDPNVTGPADGKADALAITGADCERIGTLYCTSTPRRIYQISY